MKLILKGIGQNKIQIDNKENELTLPGRESQIQRKKTPTTGYNPANQNPKHGIRLKKKKNRYVNRDHLSPDRNEMEPKMFESN